MTKPCVVCGNPTEWRCADCGIANIHKSHPTKNERADVAVCESPACRDAHEKSEQEAHKNQV